MPPPGTIPSRRLEEDVGDQLAAAAGPCRVVDLLEEVLRSHRPDDEVLVGAVRGRGGRRRVGRRGVAGERPVADHVCERGVRVRGQEDEVVDVGTSGAPSTASPARTHSPPSDRRAGHRTAASGSRS